MPLRSSYCVFRRGARASHSCTTASSCAEAIRTASSCRRTGLHVFERQVRHLRRHYRIVPAPRLLDAVRSRRVGQRFPVAITFDDDLANHVAVALPILRRHATTATFFLGGASLHGPFTFWWERLQRAVDQGVGGLHELVAAESSAARLTQSLRELARAIVELPPAARDRVAARLSEAVGPDPPDSGLRAEDVRVLASSGMTVGFHTRRHDPLTRLGDDELAQALVDGREALAAIVDAPIDCIGYPHGRADARVAAAAETAGFRTGFTTKHVPVMPDDHPLLQGRIWPSPRSSGVLALQLVHALLMSSSGREQG